jgi:rhodanese-related sulfurtransferase
MSRKFVVLWSIALVAALAMGACGGGDAPAAEAPAAAPLAATEEATAAVAEVATEVATEAPAEVAAPAEPVAEAFDVNGALDAFASAIPDGFASMGKLDDVKAAVEAGALLIDVREASEYAEGHIPGAINIPLRTVAQNLDKIPTDKPVLVYCASGLRAGTTVATLRALGYDNVKSFPGGWKAWSGANEAVSTEATAATVVTPKEVNPELLAVADAFLSGIPEGFYSIGAVEKLQEAIDNGAVLIDVREAGEFADGAIPGAINIPIRTLLQNLDKVPADQPRGHGQCHSAHGGLRQCARFPGRLRRLGSSAGNSRRYGHCHRDNDRDNDRDCAGRGRPGRRLCV